MIKLDKQLNYRKRFKKKDNANQIKIKKKE